MVWPVITGTWPGSEARVSKAKPPLLPSGERGSTGRPRPISCDTRRRRASSTWRQGSWFLSSPRSGIVRLSRQAAQEQGASGAPSPGRSSTSQLQTADESSCAQRR
jgi:hypothetical protein